jgi:hypothetical protein
LIDAYKSGTTGLRSLRLGVVEVNAVVDAHMDEVDLVEEVHELLVAGSAAMVGFDDDELELEFQKLSFIEPEVINFDQQEGEVGLDVAKEVVCDLRMPVLLPALEKEAAITPELVSDAL